MVDHQLLFTSAVELGGKIRTGQVSCVEVVEAHLRQMDSANPSLNAVVTRVDEQALERAEVLDHQLSRGQEIGLLGGLPIAHKDLSLTRGVRTTFGSLAMADHVPAENSLLVQRMHDAGGIMLGKTNTPEYGAGSHTFNQVFGLTRNPYDLTRSCGGSSGGSAVALAAGMVSLADGSDMGGSLRNPAAWCNVVGLRPSLGRVPAWPNANPKATLPVDGPMARTVQDLALLMAVIGRPDSRSPLSVDLPEEDFLATLERPLEGLRIAVSPDYGQMLPLVADMPEYISAAGELLAQRGARLTPELPDLRGADPVFKTLRAHLYAQALGPTLDQHRDQYKASLIWNIEQGLGQGAEEVSAAYAQRELISQRVSAFFQRYDFLLLPVTQVHPFDAAEEYPSQISGQPMATYLDWMQSCYFITVAGNPALSVPAGFTPQGLPVGVQIVGRPGDDFGVLQIGYALQQCKPYWQQRPPSAAA